ncbi:MAG: rhomboid family intramembrane serine protease [Phycisphaerae bacterium]
MGIADRDYVRQDPRGGYGASFGGGPKNWSVTTWLLVLNIGIFVLDAVLRVNTPYGPVGLLFIWGFFSYETAVEGLQLWRWITFQFLHGGLGHIFGNMIGLYFFGAIIENYLGSRRFLAFYLLCGIAGPVAYLLISALGILNIAPSTPLIGASAGVYGILIAAARMAPNARVQLLFPPVELTLKTMAWILLGIALFTTFTRGQNAGGEAAHLGGAALGFLLITYPHLLDFAGKFGKKQKQVKQPGYMKYRE